MDVGQRPRARDPGVVAGHLELRRALGLLGVDGVERLLDRVGAAGGDEPPDLALLTPRRFDLQPGVGAEVEAVRNLGSQLTVHGPMVTVVPGARRGGGNLAGLAAGEIRRPR